MMFEIKCLSTGKIHFWNLSDVLYEINRDRSSEWTCYTVRDWREGWFDWVEGDYFSMIGVSHEG